MHQHTLLFLGDCNTLGTPDIEGQAYPEQLAKIADIRTINCGHTMTTVREAQHYYQLHSGPDLDGLVIQYGLVDSWKTFKYSPYVLYYPDHWLRKWGRKLVKKYKKWCKKLGLNGLIGEKNVVSLNEYRQHISRMVEDMAPRPVVLIETIPNKDTSRNDEIRRYNQCLADISKTHSNAHLLPLYEDFACEMQAHYSDPTHLSLTGHQFVSRKLLAALQAINTAQTT